MGSETKPIVILVDAKNLALYSGGISHWFKPLLSSWIANNPKYHFILIGPSHKFDFLQNIKNWEFRNVHWPNFLPRFLRHPVYDLFLFPFTVNRIAPDYIFSPYHDVYIPSKYKSCITVHDLCFDELKSVYPRRIRHYYLALLKKNLQSASLVLTVSETTRNKLINHYGLDKSIVEVVYNTLPNSFHNSNRNYNKSLTKFTAGSPLVLYTGGADYRKNINNFIKSMTIFMGVNPSACILVTGQLDKRWNLLLETLPCEIRGAFVFVGKLSDEDLYSAYKSADVVVYPSFCEGFGRACLEAMGVGVPLACSDLPVMREVAGTYAHYFNPYDPKSISSSVQAAVEQGKSSSVFDQRFERHSVEAQFLRAMNKFINSK